MSNLKQVDLYEKVSKFVPEKYKDIHYAKPSKEIEDLVSLERKKKRSEIAAKKPKK